MKIKKVAGKKVPPAPDKIQKFVSSVLESSQEGVSANLQSACESRLTEWPFPKSDLFHWLPLLDYFDQIMENIINENWRCGVQTQEIADTTLLCRMLEFTRILLENCSSRNIYASYERLKNLLASSHMEIVEKVLELLLVPARKLDSQTSLRATFEKQIGTDELAIIAQLNLPFIPEMGEEEEAQFALVYKELHAIRLQSIDGSLGEYLKMLATAIFLMAQPEGSIDKAFFAMSPTIVSDTSKLLNAFLKQKHDDVSPTSNSQERVGVASVAILRSCLKSSSRWNEIVHSLHLSSSHGVITNIFKNISASMNKRKDLCFSSMFIHGYLDFISVICSQEDIDDAFVNCGILVEMLHALEEVHWKYYKVYEKVIYCLDALLYNYESALDSFFQNNGLVVIVKQINFILHNCGILVERRGSVAGCVGEGDREHVELANTHIFSCLLRFLDKLTNGNGSDDRLRHLLDGSLFKDFVLLFDSYYRSSQEFNVFSDDIISHALNITANFIHNEPSSLAVLNEIGTPQSMISALTRRIPINADCISKIPSSYSALCLNDTGKALFRELNPIKTLVSMFINEDYAKLLRTKSTASSLGTSVDEFMRHHPEFRGLVIDNIISLLNSIPANVQNDDHSTDLPRDSSENVVLEKRVESPLSRYLEVISMFIEGVIQTNTHGQEFISKGGVDALMKIFSGNGISHDFTIFNESVSISHMLRMLMDTDAKCVVDQIFKNIHLFDASQLLLSSPAECKLENSCFQVDVEYEEANRSFKKLASALAMVGILRDFYVTHSYTFVRNSGSLLATFLSEHGISTIHFLARLLKRCLFEFISILNSFGNNIEVVHGIKWIAKKELKANANTAFMESLAQTVIGVDSHSCGCCSEKEPAKLSPHTRTYYILLFTLSRTITNINSIFGGLSKMISSRNFDSEQNRDLVDVVAKGVMSSLSWPESSSPENIQIPLVNQAFCLLDAVCFDFGSGQRKAFNLPIFSCLVADLGLAGAVDDSLHSFIQVWRSSATIFSYNEALQKFFHFYSKVTDPDVKLAPVDIQSAADAGLERFHEDLFGTITKFIRLDPSILYEFGSKFLKDVDISHLLLEILCNFASLSESFTDRVGAIFKDAVSLLITVSKDVSIEVANIFEDLVEAKYNVSAYVEWFLSGELDLKYAFACLAAALGSSNRKTIMDALSIDKVFSMVKSASKEHLGIGILLISEIVYFSTTTPNAARNHLESDPSKSQLLDEIIEFVIALLKTNHHACIGGDDDGEDVQENAADSSDLDMRMSCLYFLSAITRTKHTLNLDTHELTTILINTSTKCLCSKDHRYRMMNSLSTMIVRHLIEQPEYLRLLQENELLSHNLGYSPAHTFRFIENNQASFTRDYAACIEAVRKHFCLTWDHPNWTDISKCKISKKKLIYPSDQVIEEAPTLEQLSADPGGIAKEFVASLVKIIMTTTKYPSLSSAEENVACELDEEVIRDHFIRCASIQILTEIIHSYPCCRVALMALPCRDDFFVYIFSKMTPAGELAGSLGSRVFVNESMWVSQLCDDVCNGPVQLPITERVIGLTDRVNAIVDPLMSALETFNAENSAVATYSPMSQSWCLIMTIFVLLSVKSGTQRLSTGNSTGSIQSAIAARMLERGSITTLSNILKKIDSKAPMAPIVATKVIFCLELLTRLGLKLAKYSTIGAGGSQPFLLDMENADDMDGDDSEAEDGMDDGMMSEENDSISVDDSDEDSDDDSDDGDDSDEDSEDEFGEEFDYDMDVDEGMGTGMSGYSGNEEEDEDLESIHPDDIDGMIGDSMANYNEFFDQEPSSDEDMLEYIVEPPLATSSSTPNPHFSRGFQIIPINEAAASMAASAGAERMFTSLLRDGEQRMDLENIDEFNMFSDFEDDDDDDEREGFSDGDDDGAQIDRSMFPHSLQRRSLDMSGDISGGTSYAAQTRDLELYYNPLLSHADLSKQKTSIEIAGAKEDEKDKPWMQNKAIFHNPLIPSTLKRWTMESKIFFKGDFQGLDDYSDLLKKALEEEATARRDSELAKAAKALENETISSSSTSPRANHSTNTDQNSMDVDRDDDAAESDESETLTSNQSTGAAANNVPVQPFVDRGPDADFIVALPFEMRREVLEQYFEERRQMIPENARVEIDSTFLASLPQDLRETYQTLSDREVSRYQRRSVRGFDSRYPDLLSSLGANAQESFLETIYETERLMSSTGERHAGEGRGAAMGGERISSLIRSLGDSVRRMQGGANTPNALAPPLPPTEQSPGIASPTLSINKCDYSNMMDPTSLATVLLAYYNPVMTDYRTHLKLFQHLCDADESRRLLLNMLIYVLEEMPETISDLSSVLSSFNHQSESNSKSSRNTPKKRNKSSTPFGGSSFVVIQQRTLQLLMQLVHHSQKVRSFFTTPLPSPWTIKRWDKKSKAPVNISTNYPIVVLLACLEKSRFIETGVLIENLLHLLYLTSTPLQLNEEKSEEEKQKLEKISIPKVQLVSLVRTVIHHELGPKASNYSRLAFEHLSNISEAGQCLINELVVSAVQICDSTSKMLAGINQSNFNDLLDETNGPISIQMKLVRCIKILASCMLKSISNHNDAHKDSLTDRKLIDWKLVRKIFRNKVWDNLRIELERVLSLVTDGGNADTLVGCIESFFWHTRIAVLLFTKNEENLKIEEKMTHFANSNRKILNSMIRITPALLTSGAFVLLTKHSKYLDFDNKRSLFYSQILPAKRTSRSSLNISVRRSNVFEDSYHAIMSKGGKEFKTGRLVIKFYDEEGQDAGGVAREWFTVLSRQMFDPNYALFKASAVDKITYQPNRMSFVNPDHLLYFGFVGRIIGKAIYDQRLLDCYFTRSFYKHILHLNVDIMDLESVEPEFYNSLMWMINNDITDVMDLTFSVESDDFGDHKVVDLVPGGQEKAVTEENKIEYVRLMAEYKLSTAIRPQIDAFLRGFHEVIPVESISLFNEHELELLISGMPDIDVDDWKNNTEYQGYTVASPQVQWFWRAIRSFDQEYRAKVMQFVTGTSKVPLDGFANLQGSSGIQKFQIHKDFKEKDRLPSAHTCFNQIDIPEYESYEQLYDRLMKAVNECGTGFGLA